MALVCLSRVFSLSQLMMLTACVLVVNATSNAQDSSYVAMDGFYIPPAQISIRAGTLLKSEPLLGRDIPAGARAWRIQYTTSRSSGQPVTAVATVLAPVTDAAGMLSLLDPSTKGLLGWYAANAYQQILSRCDA